MTNEKQTIALVLSGGAARGLAHIGVIEELEKHNFEIKSIAGNSMGAFVGAIYASGQLPQFKEWILSLGKKDMVKLADISISRKGFVKGEKLFRELKTFLPDVNIEDLPISYRAIAADLTNMQEVVFDSGNLADAVRASIAIPGVFKPFNKDGALLVDGGVVNPIPLNRVQRNKGDLLVGSFVNAKSADITKTESKKSERLFSIMSRTSNLLTYSLAMANIERYQPDMLINVSRDACGAFEFYKIEEMIEHGRKSAALSLSSPVPISE